MTANPRSLARRRVLISGGLNVGGPQTHVSLLARILVEVGAEVTIAAASSNWPPEALAPLRALGVRIVVSPFGFGRWKFLGNLWCVVAWPFLLRRDYDLLYCIGEGKMHLWASRFVAPGAWKIYHEIVDCPQPGSVAAQVAAKMDAVVANSRSVATEMHGLLGELPVRSIPFLISATSGGPVDRPVRRPDEPLRLAFLGRLISHKRPGELIEAFPAWNGRAPIGPARLDLYGGDYNGEGGRLQEIIDRLGLEQSVRLHGAYATGSLPALFAATDLVVLPSRYEGLPLVLVEAMLRGVPVVATSAGGTAELGDDNPDVIVTPGTDWNAFEAGVAAMAARIRGGQVDAARLQAWTEARYGYRRVAETWRAALLSPETFFAEKSATPAAATEVRRG